MQCAESLRVQAYFDGELDAVSSALLEEHLIGCAACRACLAQLEQLRVALRSEVNHEPAPAALRARVIDALDRDDAFAGLAPREKRAERPWHSRAFWSGALGGVGTAAVAACVAFFMLLPPKADPLVENIVNAHVRSLMPAHLIDVVSADRHTVKPWFAGHADVSPVVADFEPQGYKLVGGRADYVDRQHAAVVVYQHGAHVINVFSWNAETRPLPAATSRDGYHMIFWQIGNVAYCAVSDAGWDEMRVLAVLLKGLGAKDAQGPME